MAYGLQQRPESGPYDTLATRKWPFGMSRTPSAFKQVDVTRALNAARAAGYNAARILIGTDGRIEIVTTMGGEATAAMAAEAERREQG